MKISILIPTYNRASYLKEAIDSALKQTHKDLEIIISDNCSTDNTSVVVNSYKNLSNVRVYRNAENLGMVGNWHQMLYEYVRGDFFLILSDDDVLLDPNYIVKAVELIKSDEQIKLVYANGVIRYEFEKRDVPLSLPFSQVSDGKDILLSRGMVQPIDFMLCNVLFHTELSKKFKSFDNPNNLSCDSELFIKLAIVGKVGIVKTQASLYRIHNDNLVLKIVKDYNLFINNWEFVSSSLKVADKENYFTESEKEAFYRRVIKPLMFFSVSNAYIHHIEKHEQVIAKLQKDFGQDLWERYSHGKVISKLLKLNSKLARWIFLSLVKIQDVIVLIREKIK